MFNVYTLKYSPRLLENLKKRLCCHHLYIKTYLRVSSLACHGLLRRPISPFADKIPDRPDTGYGSTSFEKRHICLTYLYLTATFIRYIMLNGR